MHWDAEIAEFAWDDHFCDEQVRGPFASWRHCHRLSEESRDGVMGTLVVDDVMLAFPFGGLGNLTYHLGGGKQVRSLFRYRQRQLLRLLGKDLAQEAV